MAFLYLGITVVVIIFRFVQIPVVFEMIMSNAFSANAAFGGAIGITVIQGVKKGLFTNEAAMGSMALLNIAAILLLRKDAYMLLNDFESQLK